MQSQEDNKYLFTSTEKNTLPPINDFFLEDLTDPLLLNNNFFNEPLHYQNNHLHF